MINPLWSYIFGPPKEKKTLIEMLKGLPVFEGLSTGELVLVERHLHERHYVGGETIFNEQEPSAAMYIVHSGQVEITKHIEDGRNVQLAVIKQGNFFGELALLDEMPRSASAHPIDKTVLLGFCRPDLDNILERNPKLGIIILNNISRLVCRRLIAANENIKILQNKLDKFGIKSEGE